MTKIGIIGMGDMGSGIAKNLLAKGFEVWGYDLSPARMRAFAEMGGHAAQDLSEVGEAAAAVFIMVMTGTQARDVIFGQAGAGGGLTATMPAGSCIILTATIKPSEAEEIAAGLAETNIHLIDSPVSGGFPGAQNGTLTMMAAGSVETMATCRPFMEAISAQIHHVGDTAPQGQIMKACLQSLIGSIFSATFEAAVLAAKAGVKGETLYEVVASSSAGCGAANTALKHIIERKFEGTGSHIATMHKDLTISLALAEELGVPLHTASTAMQLFHAGKSKYPKGDNWVVTRVLEEIVGAELHK